PNLCHCARLPSTHGVARRFCHSAALGVWPATCFARHRMRHIRLPSIAAVCLLAGVWGGASCFLNPQPEPPGVQPEPPYGTASPAVVLPKILGPTGLRAARPVVPTPPLPPEAEGVRLGWRPRRAPEALPARAREELAEGLRPEGAAEVPAMRQRHPRSG